MFARVARTWPFEVSMVGLICFLIASEVNPGQVAKNPVSMAFVQVESTGFHMVWWENVVISFFFLSS